MTTIGIARAVAVAAAFLAIGLVTSPDAGAQAAGESRQQARQVSTAVVSEQLGLKTSPGQADALLVGASITCVLVDPAKLAALGAPGLHVGARVTFMRVAADKLRVEADEIDPVPLTKKLTLSIDQQGRLSAVTS
jgi:hypothetical protein